jgi:hypothetical protein
MGPLLAVTLLIVAALAALALAAVGIVATFTALSNAYNADAIAAENAAIAAKILSEAYDECRQKYENMISTMENYKTAREGLESLTKGTVEYQEALFKANE